MKIVLIFIFAISFFVLAQEKEHKVLDFNNIKEVIKNDMLERNLQKQKKAIKKKKKARQKSIRQKYQIPSEGHFWSIISEYWLVKNVSTLKWDTHGPQYGIALQLKKILSSIGLDSKTIKVLFVDTTELIHFALPSNSNELIFLLSRPFVNKLNLSPLEGALLLFEDYLRIKQRYFHQFVSPKGLSTFLGSNFHKKKFKKKIIDQILAGYSKMVFDKGFSFKEQFKITGKMKEHFGQSKMAWNAYKKLLQKIDLLVKEEKAYKSYLKIYPSPELQLNWISAFDK